jgi:putative peptidoglycan lipid II flippase
MLALAETATLAHFFGAGRTIEVFFAASMLGAIALKFTQVGLWGELLVPELARERAGGGSDQGWALVSSTINLLLVVAAAVMAASGAAVWLGARWLVPGFAAGDRGAVVRLFVLLTPSFLLTILAGVMIAALNAHKRFGQPEFAKLLGRAAGLAALVLLATPLGIAAAVLAATVAAMVQVGALGVLLRRFGYRHRWTMEWRREAFSRLRRAIRPYVAYTIVVQVVQGGMLATLSLLPSGAFGALRYVQRLYEQVNVTLLRAVPTVAYPWIAEAAAQDDRAFRQRLFETLRMLVFVSAPLSLGLVITGPGVVDVLFRHGAFEGAAARLAGELLAIMGLLFAFDGAFVVLRQALIAVGRSGLVNALAIGIQVALMAAFYVLTTTAGAAGAVLANLLVTVGGVAVYWYALRRLRPFPRQGVPMLAYWARVGAALAVAGSAAVAARTLLDRVGVGTALAGVGREAGAWLVLLTVYGVSAAWVRLEEVTKVREVASLLRARLRPSMEGAR